MSALSMMVWNCAGGFRRKAHVVARSQPDIAIISEIGDDAGGCFAEATSVASIGTANGRGLAVIGFNGWRIEPAGLSIDERLFLPVRAIRDGDSVQLAGVCVKRDRSYVDATLRAFQTLEPFIRSSPTILAGDFNQSAAFDLGRGPGRRFADVTRALEKLGLKSAWHAHRHESFGSESAPTYFDRRTKTNWHIDYCFVPQEIELISVNLHSFDDIVLPKISDHAPLTVSLTGIGDYARWHFD